MLGACYSPLQSRVDRKNSNNSLVQIYGENGKLDVPLKRQVSSVSKGLTNEESLIGDLKLESLADDPVAEESSSAVDSSQDPPPSQADADSID